MESKIIVAPDNEDPSSICPHGLGYMLHEHMKKHQDNVAQIDVLTGHKDTYKNLLQRCIRTAIELKSRGITREDIITLNTNNHLNSSVPFIAAQFLGCKVASLDPSLPVEDARYLLEQVNPTIIFTIASAEEVTRNAINTLPKKPEIVVFDSASFDVFIRAKSREDSFKPAKVDPTETAVILFSSGTTGMPKGILGSHRMHVKSAKSCLCTTDMTTSLYYSSLYWISGVNFLIESCRQGVSRLLVPKFEPAQFWNVVETYKATQFFCAPTQLVLILKNKPKGSVDLSSLSTVLLGGGPVPIDYLTELTVNFPHMNIIQGWGQTELGIVTKFMNTDEQLELTRKHPLSCGMLLPGMAAKVVDTETNLVLGPNEIGEIRVKTIYQMNGYHNRDSTGIWDSDGFICTGDIGYYNTDRCFFIVDRLKEMMKYQSWHVIPVKIEAVLLKHPAVSEAVVIGKPHDIDGEHPMALVVPNKQSTVVITPEELRRYADEQLDDRHKLRGGVIFMNKLLYTTTGKFKRSEMRKQIMNGIRTF